MNDMSLSREPEPAGRSRRLNHTASDDERSARRAAWACAMTLAVALGVGRFAFTPLLPLMLASGALDIRHGGWLASANYAGYFVGAMTCARITLAPARMVRAGLVATVLLTLAMGVASPFAVWACVRFVAGAVSAWTFVFASQWGLRRLAELDAPAWGGVIYTGPGFGIVVTGLLGSVLAGQRAAYGWIGFALLSALLAACVWRVFGAPATARPASAAPALPAGDAAHGPRGEAGWLVVLYGLPGFGYIITATFLPVIARAALPAGSGWSDLFWPMFGAALIAGALIGARLPIRWDNRALLAGSCALQALGVALGIVWPTVAGFALGSVLLGLPFTAITLFAMREARRLRGERAAGLMGYATASYGIGQIAGPLVAAPLVARAGTFAPALGLASASLVLGAAGFAAIAWRAASHARRTR
jgi:predicted MFS family arabinose efflux permease